MSTQDDRTQSELLNDLRFGSPQVQEEALSQLTAVGEAEALDAIIDYLRDQPPGTCDVGLDAVRVLANKYMPVDRYGLADAVIPFLSSEQWAHRLTATRLLSVHPNELATDALRDLVDEARTKLIEERRNRLSPQRIIVERTLVEGVLAMAYSGRLLVLPDVIEMLEDRALRALATRAIGIIGSETERDRLEDLAEDEDFRVRDAAQWALGLMDERIEMFTRPPDQIPEPPPDRLSPVYWAHRQLFASEDELIQFLVVRVAVEHLLLDALLSDNRVPEQCLIITRRYDGQVPPDFRSGEAEVTGLWRYLFHGPDLIELEASSIPPTARGGLGTGRSSSITVSYPAALDYSDEGLVSFDCLFEPLAGRGWLYRITRQDGTWTFKRVRKTWSS